MPQTIRGSLILKSGALDLKLDALEKETKGFLRAKYEKDGIARALEAVHRALEKQPEAQAEFTAGVYAGVYHEPSRTQKIRDVPAGMKKGSLHPCQIQEEATRI